MYTEELGVSPEANGGARLYRARVAQLIAKGHAFAQIDDGEVVFKAELGAVTPHAAQLQSVWVDPRHRGRGMAAGGVAAVCALALNDVAPVVSLYVNQHNEPARRDLRPRRLRHHRHLRHHPLLDDHPTTPTISTSSISGPQRGWTRITLSVPPPLAVVTSRSPLARWTTDRSRP